MTYPGFDLRRLLKEQSSRESTSFEDNRQVMYGITINRDYPDSSEVAGAPGYNYVYLHATRRGDRGVIRMVYNNGVSNRVGLPVKVARDINHPDRLTIIGPDASVSVFLGWWSNEYANETQGPHARTHEWPDGNPGSDVVSVYRRSLVPLRTYITSASSFTIAVSPWYFIYDGSVNYFSGLESTSITSYIGSSGVTYIMVYHDPITNTIKFSVNVVNTVIWPGFSGGASTIAEHVENFPSVPDLSYPSAVLVIPSSAAALTEQNVIDIRQIYAVSLASAVASAQKQLALVESELDFAISKIVVG